MSRSSPLGVVTEKEIPSGPNGSLQEILSTCAIRRAREFIFGGGAQRRERRELSVSSDAPLWTIEALSPALSCFLPLPSHLKSLKMSLKDLQALFKRPKAPKDPRERHLACSRTPYAATDAFIAAFNLRVPEFQIPDSIFKSSPVPPDVSADGSFSFAEAALDPRLQAFGPVKGSRSDGTPSRTIPDMCELFRTIYRPSVDDRPSKQDKLTAFASAGVPKMLICGRIWTGESDGQDLWSPPLLMVVACPTLAYHDRCTAPWRGDDVPFVEHGATHWNAVLASLHQNSRAGSTAHIGKRSPEEYHRSLLVSFPQHGGLTKLIAIASQHSSIGDEHMDRDSRDRLYMSRDDAIKWIDSSIDHAHDSLDGVRKGAAAAAVIPACLPLPAKSPLPIGIYGTASLGFTKFRQLIRNQYGRQVAETLDTSLIREWVDFAARDPNPLIMDWLFMAMTEEWFARTASWSAASFFHRIQLARYHWCRD